MSAASIAVGPAEGELRLDRWFKRHYPDLPHGRLEKLLRTGQVRVDGGRAKAGQRLQPGQIVRVPPLNLTPAPAPGRPPGRKIAGAEAAAAELLRRVIHRDDDVLIIDKPAGLAVQGGSGTDLHLDALLDALRFGAPERPRLVHRLDKDTSGVLVVARTVPAAAELSRALATRDAQKIYWALVKGVPKVKRGTIKAALAKEGGHGPRGRDERMTTVDAADEGAKDAVTDYVVLGTAGEELAWLAVRPKTGRTHQIRVHLASLGTPIVGDFKYGGTDVRGRGEIENRLHLHARSIDIARPDGGRLHADAPLPPHMLKTWELLGFDANAGANPFEPKKKRK